MSRALYVYGLSDYSDLEVSAAPGVGGSVPTVVSVDGLGAIVGEIDAQDFADRLGKAAHPGDLESHLRAHEAVLDHAIAQADLVPLRFGTVVRDKDGLRELVARHRDGLQVALDVAKGRVEWGVLVHAPANATKTEPATVPSSGRDYLQSKSTERKDRLAREADMVRAASLINKGLSEISSDVVVLSVNDVAEEDTVFLSRAAYLVERTKEEDFLKQAEGFEHQFGPQGLTIEVSGPWPPYNFTALEIDD